MSDKKLVQQIPFNQRRIKESIFNYLNMANISVDQNDHQEPVITDRDRLMQMTDSLTQFVCRSIDKYLAGQLEHGGDICERDLDRELYNEHIDFFWYTEARQWK